MCGHHELVIIIIMMLSRPTLSSSTWRCFHSFGSKRQFVPRDVVVVGECNNNHHRIVKCKNFSSHKSMVVDELERHPIVTDEGIVLYQADPSASSSDHHGLVWGSVLWPSGISLSKYVVHRYSNTNKILPNRKKRILELGCGTGIVGLTLAKQLPECSVTLTDSETKLWPLLRRNIEANLTTTTTTTTEEEDDSILTRHQMKRRRVTIHELDWRDPSTFLPPNDFDLIVAADVLYSGMDKLFARALASHLVVSKNNDDNNNDNCNEAWVACPFRTDSPLSGFFTACSRLGLEMQRLEDDQGRAMGADLGVDPATAFSNSQFVPINKGQQQQQQHSVTVNPEFGPGNERKVQIFRIRRITGTPEEAIRIRRVSRI
eukprot:scaffold2190_cov72-Cylindrotheca_fusiformis.AAC.4